MEFQKAVIKSIRSYYEGNSFDNTGKLKDIKYKKEYFDTFEEEQFSKQEAKSSPQERKPDPKKQAMLAEVMAAGNQKEQESVKMKGEEGDKGQSIEFPSK